MPRLQGRLRGWWLVLLLVLTGLLCSCGSAARPAPIAWEAFYVRSVAAVSVFPSAPSGAYVCQWRLDLLTESASRIQVQLDESDEPRHAVCVAYPGQGRVIRLKAPVGNRVISSSSTDREAAGTAYDLLGRVHLPISTAADMPLAAASGTTWTTLYVHYRGATSRIRLVSQPAPAHAHQLHGLVRGHPLVKPCRAGVCWIEDGLLYQLDTYGSPTNIALLRRLATEMEP